MRIKTIHVNSNSQDAFFQALQNSFYIGSISPSLTSFISQTPMPTGTHCLYPAWQSTAGMRCPQMVKTVGQSSIFFNKNTKIILGGLYPQDLMTFEKAQFPVLERSFSSYERLFPCDKDRSLDPSLHTGQFTGSCNSSFKGYDTLVWPLLVPHTYMYIHPHVHNYQGG